MIQPHRTEDRCALCGHRRPDHYEWSLNGETRTRCSSCDPLSGLVGNVEIEANSFAQEMYEMSEHDYEEAVDGSA